MAQGRIPRRVRWIIVLGCALGIVGGGFWFVVTRWDGVPADPRVASLPPETAPSMSDLYYHQPFPIQIPHAPLLNTLLPPPQGKTWQGSMPSQPAELELERVLDGAWLPETRPHLQAAIKYLGAPATETLIEQLAVLDVGEHRFARYSDGRFCAIRHLLLAHARYVLEDRGDYDRAVRDLEVLLRLVGQLYELDTNSSSWVAWLSEWRAMEEVRCLVIEHGPTSDQAERLITILESALPERAAFYDHRLAADVDAFLFDVEFSFTCDADGDGWLVLSQMGNTRYPTISSASRCGAWNLLSPLYNSRRTVVNKIRYLQSVCETVRDMPWGEAKRHLSEVLPEDYFSLLDGPVCMCARGYAQWLKSLTSVCIAGRHATIVTVALSSYRAQHGEYPPSLDALLSDGLQQFPEDPLAIVVGAPLRYMRLAEQDDYVLYSVGDDQRDDLGQGHARNGQDDIVYRHLRGSAWGEPSLE